jgi:hypothetical protein
MSLTKPTIKEIKKWLDSPSDISEAIDKVSFENGLHYGIKLAGKANKRKEAELKKRGLDGEGLSIKDNKIFGFGLDEFSINEKELSHYVLIRKSVIDEVLGK